MTKEISWANSTSPPTWKLGKGSHFLRSKQWPELLIFWALSWNQDLAKNNFGEEKLWIRVWNKDSQVLEGALQENELEQAEFGVNSCIITDHEDSDGMCEGQTS